MANLTQNLVFSAVWYEYKPAIIPYAPVTKVSSEATRGREGANHVNEEYKTTNEKYKVTINFGTALQGTRLPIGVNESGKKLTLSLINQRVSGQNLFKNATWKISDGGFDMAPNIYYTSADAINQYQSSMAEIGKKLYFKIRHITHDYYERKESYVADGYIIEWQCYEKDGLANHKYRSNDHGEKYTFCTYCNYNDSESYTDNGKWTELKYVDNTSKNNTFGYLIYRGYVCGDTDGANHGSYKSPTRFGKKYAGGCWEQWDCPHCGWQHVREENYHDHDYVPMRQVEKKEGGVIKIYQVEYCLNCWHERERYLKDKDEPPPPPDEKEDPDDPYTPPSGGDVGDCLPGREHHFVATPREPFSLLSPRQMQELGEKNIHNEYSNTDETYHYYICDQVCTWCDKRLKFEDHYRSDDRFTWVGKEEHEFEGGVCTICGYKASSVNCQHKFHISWHSWDSIYVNHPDKYHCSACFNFATLQCSNCLGYLRVDGRVSDGLNTDPKILKIRIASVDGNGGRDILTFKSNNHTGKGTCLICGRSIITPKVNTFVSGESYDSDSNFDVDGSGLVAQLRFEYESRITKGSILGGCWVWDVACMGKDDDYHNKNTYGYYHTVKYDARTNLITSCLEYGKDNKDNIKKVLFESDSYPVRSDYIDIYNIMKEVEKLLMPELFDFYCK